MQVEIKDISDDSSCDICGVDIQGEPTYFNDNSGSVFCSEGCQEQEFLFQEEVHCHNCGALAEFDTSELDSKEIYHCYKCEE